MNLISIHESLNLNYLFALELHLGEVLIVDDHVLAILILIAFYNVFGLKSLTRNLVFFLIADRVMALLRKKVKTDGLPSVDGIVNPNGNCYQRKLNVSFPDSSHN